MTQKSGLVIADLRVAGPAVKHVGFLVASADGFYHDWDAEAHSHGAGGRAGQGGLRGGGFDGERSRWKESVSEVIRAREDGIISPRYHPSLHS